MGVMKRLTSIVQAKANKALDRAEDPRDTLDLSYEKQLEQLQQVRRGVADVATARKRLELQAKQLQASAQKLQDQARQAIAQNREDIAREALGRRSAIGTQLEQLKAQHDQLVQQEDRLVATTQTLEARVAAFRTQKETLKASYTAAQAQTKIGEAVSGISESMSDTGLAMQRAQDKIEQMQARAGAVDELLESGALTDLSGTSDSIQYELDKTSRQNQVDLELAQLKGELAPPQPGTALTTGTGEAATGENAESAPTEAGTTSEPGPMPAAAPASGQSAPPSEAGESGEGGEAEGDAADGDLFSLDDGAQQ